MADRILRIANEMKKVISDLLIYEMKDPRIPVMTSVMHIKLAKDLKYAKVYVSVFGSEAQKNSALVALENSVGYIRREIGKRMFIRQIPELTFELDETIERGAYLTELINKTVSKDNINGGKDE